MTGVIHKPEIQAILNAWASGNDQEAIALTAQYASSLRVCAHCGKFLAPQARGNYCKNHRNHDPARKADIYNRLRSSVD